MGSEIRRQFESFRGSLARPSSLQVPLATVSSCKIKFECQRSRHYRCRSTPLPNFLQAPAERNIIATTNPQHPSSVGVSSNPHPCKRATARLARRAHKPHPRRKILHFLWKNRTAPYVCVIERMKACQNSSAILKFPSWAMTQTAWNPSERGTSTTQWKYFYPSRSRSVEPG
jgi:hypothetical protein